MIAVDLPAITDPNTHALTRVATSYGNGCFERRSYELAAILFP